MSPKEFQNWMDDEGKTLGWNNYFVEVDDKVTHRGQVKDGKPYGLGIMIDKSDPTHEHMY